MNNFPKLGRVSYVNCLPIFHPIETGCINIPANLISCPPAELNLMFEQGQLDITAISSIEYARFHQQAFILPQLSISSHGEVGSVCLISKVPVHKLNGAPVFLTAESATSAALLQILFNEYYRVKPQFLKSGKGLDEMLALAEGALVIGDKALTAVQNKKGLYIYDLGQEWLEFSGYKMVFALWVVRQSYVKNHREQVVRVWKSMLKAKSISQQNLKPIITAAAKETGLSPRRLKHYFQNQLNYDLTGDHLEGLQHFYNLSFKNALLPESVKINLWGENIA